MSETQTLAIDRKVVFVCESRAVSVRDVLDAAWFRGEVQPALQELLRLQAAENKADADDLEYNDDAIDAAAERFRYDHDLITAEETEQYAQRFGESYGRDPAELFDRYQREQSEGAFEYWAVGTPRTLNNFAHNYPVFRIAGITARNAWNAARRLAFIISSQTASSVSWSAPPVKPPARWTSASTRPQRATTVSTMRPACAGSSRSAGTARKLACGKSVCAILRDAPAT